MDEISQGPREDRRPFPKPPRWLTSAAIAALVGVVAVVAMTRGDGQHRAATASPISAPASPASVAPGMPGSRAVTVPGPVNALAGVRLTTTAGSQEVVTQDAAVAGAPVAMLNCQSAIWAQLDPDWRTGSLRVGSLWFVAEAPLGYVHLGRGTPAGVTVLAHTTSRHNVDMLLHLAAGSTVVMRVAPASWPYFRFLDGTGTPLASDKAFIFTACPASDSRASFNDFYEIGYSLAAGHTASVEVWTGLAHPVWVTLAAPAGD